MGHQVFSNGAYLDPAGHPSLARPGILGGYYNPDYERIARMTPKTEIPDSLIDPFDVIIVMHTPEILDCNWKKIRHKKVIWRSIGQSTPKIECLLAPLRNEGLKIVRYSPKEELIPSYAGSDALIRFYKDPNEFKDWNGNEKRVINFSQTLKGRRGFCHYNEIHALMLQYGGKVYGSGNEDLGTMNGGELPYEMFKQTLRDARVYLYGGTWPAAYTLSFIEAWMTGVPIVAIGKNTAEHNVDVPPPAQFEFYEVSELIEHGKTGFIGESGEELKSHIESLLSSHELATSISQNARAAAINIFGKDTIKHQWATFLNSL